MKRAAMVLVVLGICLIVQACSDDGRGGGAPNLPVPVVPVTNTTPVVLNASTIVTTTTGAP